MKRLLLPILFFVLGGATSSVGIWLYYGKTMRYTVERAAAVVKDTYASSLYTYEINEANEQISSGKNRDVAIYALERAVRKLTTFQAPQWESCRNTAYRLGEFNMRLAELYAEAGNKQAQEKHLKKAITSYEAMGWKLNNISELEQALPLIRLGKTSEAIQIYGQLIPSCLRN